MRHVPALLIRELGSYFVNPLAYVILVAIQFLAWSNFWQLLENIAGRPILAGGLYDPMNEYLSSSAQFWITVLVAVPVLTMRLLAEERRLGTIEGLQTTPTSEVEIVVAKWLAGLIFYLTALVPYFFYLPFLHQYYEFDVGPVVALAIGLTTMGMMFTAIGVFFSALSKNQVAAGIWTFVAMFALVLMSSYLASIAATRGWGPARALQFMAVLHQANEMGNGRLDLRFLALHVSTAVFFLYLAVIVLKSQRGR